MVINMASRIDFKTVRSQADFSTVLTAYDIELVKDGSQAGQFKALCPFHEDTRPSLKVNTAKNIFHCFACEAKGNILEFVAQMEGLDIRPAALKVAELCGLIEAPAKSAKRLKRPDRAQKNVDKAQTPPPAAETPVSAAGDGEGVPYNPQLSFSLKLKQDDELLEWLNQRGIDTSTIGAFELGRASKKSKTIGDRLAIPLHDERGSLIGYCGRYLGDDKTDGVPKDILPKGFRKELEIFNQHRISEELSALVIFESFFSVMRFHEHVPCVSPYGRSISSEQVTRVGALGAKHVIVVFDGDEPGRTGATQVAGGLATVAWTRVVQLPDGVKPHHLEWEDLRPHLVEVWE